MLLDTSYGACTWNLDGDRVLKLISLYEFSGWKYILLLLSGLLCSWSMPRLCATSCWITPLCKQAHMMLIEVVFFCCCYVQFLPVAMCNGSFVVQCSCPEAFWRNSIFVVPVYERFNAQCGKVWFAGRTTWSRDRDTKAPAFYVKSNLMSQVINIFLAVDFDEIPV